LALAAAALVFALIASLLHYFATVSPAEALNLWPVRATPAAASPGRARQRPGAAEGRT